MNSGPCPYNDCKGWILVSTPNRLPAYNKIICPTCNRYIWYRFSRLDPAAWTVADFEKEYEVDFKNGTIKKNGETIASKG